MTHIDITCVYFYTTCFICPCIQFCRVLILCTRCKSSYFSAYRRICEKMRRKKKRIGRNRKHKKGEKSKEKKNHGKKNCKNNKWEKLKEKKSDGKKRGQKNKGKKSKEKNNHGEKHGRKPRRKRSMNKTNQGENSVNTTRTQMSVNLLNQTVNYINHTATQGEYNATGLMVDAVHTIQVGNNSGHNASELQNAYDVLLSAIIVNETTHMVNYMKGTNLTVFCTMTRSLILGDPKNTSAIQTNILEQHLQYCANTKQENCVDFKKQKKEFLAYSKIYKKRYQKDKGQGKEIGKI